MYLLSFYMKFSSAHFAMMLKYLGISFITGGISHGFFSGTRSLIMILAGIISFVVGSILEEGIKNISWRVILSGAVLAIGIGAFTGGLQHFPDSPERSLWVVPVGFALSLVFFKVIQKYKLTRKDIWYGGVSLLLVFLISIGLFFVVENTSLFGTHSHGSSDSMSPRSSDQH